MTESSAAAGGPEAGEPRRRSPRPGLPSRPSSSCSASIAYGELSAFERLAEDAKLAPDAGRQGRDRADGRRRVRAPGPAPGAARAARRRPVRGDGVVPGGLRLLPPPHRAVRLVRGPRSRPTSATAWPPTSTARSPPTSTRTPATWSSARWRTPVTRRSSSTGSGPASTPTRRLGGRLALWGRRLMGEALTQAQRVAAERDALTALLAGGVDRPGLDLAALGSDVHPAHRAARAADGRPGPGLLTRRRAPHHRCGALRLCWCCSVQPWCVCVRRASASRCCAR